MRTVLICEDEPLIRIGMKKTLQDLGFDEVMECGDGATAVAMALERMPGVIILDVAMPELDGLSAAVEIRKRLKVPLILATACNDPQTVAKAKAVGIAAFLVKPVRDRDLWPAIELACAHADEVDRLKEQVEDLKEIIEGRKSIDKAKGVLMRVHGLTEPEAFRRIQKLAMDKRRSMRQIADAILLMQ